MTEGMFRTAEAIARGAADIAKRHFGRLKDEHINVKGDGSFVTVADMEVNEYLTRELREAFPDCGVISEEAPPEVLGAPRLWIIDPIDGTKNFMGGSPHFGVSLGLVENGVPIAGFIAIPATDELFSAQKNKGAFLNGRPIRGSDAKHLAGTKFLIDASSKEATRKYHEPVREALHAEGASSEALQCMTVSMCFVACGRYDGLFRLGLDPWDVAAGISIAREAGAVVSHFDGSPKDVFKPDTVVAGAGIHDELVALIGKTLATPPMH